MESHCLLNYDVLSVGEEHHLYLLVRVKGAHQAGDRDPLPLNLSLVIDRSGSMSGEKLEYVKQAAASLVRRLGVKDRLSLVAYDTTVQVMIPPRTVDKKPPFEQAIRTLKAGDTTNLSGGWLQGCEFVGSVLEDNAVNRVLLLSDGLANVGVQAPDALAAMARSKRVEGITTTTLGVGMDFNEDLLSKMASEGGGAFYFIDSPDQAPGFFSEELQDLYSVVGQNLTVSIESERPVRAVQQLYDYPSYEEQGALVYTLGDIYAEEERYQVFELALAPLPDGETRLGRITVSYDAIEGGEAKRQESAYDVVVKAVPKAELEVRLPVVEVEKMALLQKAARAREKAVEHADRGEFEQAAATLREVAGIIEASEIEDDELKDEHDKLLESGMGMELGSQHYDTHARKLHRSSSSSSHRHRRHMAMMEDLHMRHKLAKPAIERGAPPPQYIEWGQYAQKLTGSEWIIGRVPDCDIVLPDPRVDVRHCRLERAGDDWYLTDLGSREGTFANNGLVDGRFRLSVGDVVTVGATLFRFRGAEDPGKPNPGNSEKGAAEYLRRGQSMEKQNDFPAAIDCYRNSLACNPKDKFTAYFANNNLGYSLNQVGASDEAEAFCRKAISIDETRHNAYKNLGVSLEGQGKYVEAAVEYITAVKREPGDGRALHHLENLYRDHPEIKDGIQDFEAKLQACRDDVLSAGGAVH